VEYEYGNAEVVKFRLQFRGADSTPHKAIGLPVCDGNVSEEMIGPQFFQRFMAHVHSSPGCSINLLLSIFSNLSSMDILQTLYRKYFSQYVTNLVCVRLYFSYLLLCV
jgi:hypothetical protein